MTRLCIEVDSVAIRLALASGATFVARAIDIDTAHLTKTLEQAAHHKGIAFVEIYQNCDIYNDCVFAEFTEKEVRAEKVLYLENGKPLLFGKNRDKGLRWAGASLGAFHLEENKFTEKNIAEHDEATPEITWPTLLSQLKLPEFPVPVGVFRKIQKPTYEALLTQQIDHAILREGRGTLETLWHWGDTWVVE